MSFSFKKLCSLHFLLSINSLKNPKLDINFFLNFSGPITIFKLISNSTILSFNSSLLYFTVSNSICHFLLLVLFFTSKDCNPSGSKSGLASCGKYPNNIWPSYNLLSLNDSSPHKNENIFSLINFCWFNKFKYKKVR